MPEETAPAGEAASTAGYDVAIIGGALSGASTATLLLQKNPALRVLIIERSPVFERRGGGIHHRDQHVFSQPAAGTLGPS